METRVGVGGKTTIYRPHLPWKACMFCVNSDQTPVQNFSPKLQKCEFPVMIIIDKSGLMSAN